jgi:hypothetical protein
MGMMAIPLKYIEIILPIIAIIFAIEICWNGYPMAIPWYGMTNTRSSLHSVPNDCIHALSRRGTISPCKLLGRYFNLWKMLIRCDESL